ncbi:hypothetical protein HYV49_04175 [Candidatus Pacearchaeota archaeon]|nr:hypothetical protein [Candidatus Pacearchaeota archaeon]
MNTTSITLDRNVKKGLDRLKAHKRESYNEVIARILAGKVSRIDSESLLETIEILSDPEAMRSLATSIEQLKGGKLYSIDEV